MVDKDSSGQDEFSRRLRDLADFMQPQNLELTLEFAAKGSLSAG